MAQTAKRAARGSVCPGVSAGSAGSVVSKGPADGRLSAWSSVASSVGMLAVAFCVGVALPGCKGEANASSKAPESRMTNQVASPASKPEPPDPAPTAQATNHVSEAAFELTMKPKGDYAVGKASDLAIVLTAKAPFHVNDKYPYKFTLNKVDGVAFESDVVKGDRVKLDEKQATMTVPFTPNAKGAKTISGRFSFSVCTDEKCLIEKRELAAEINVQ